MSMKEKLLDLIDIYRDLKNTKVRSDMRKIKAKVIDDVRNIETYKAIYSEDKSLCYIPELKRVWFAPKTYQDGRENIVFLPMGYHMSPDPEKTLTVAKAQKYIGKLKSRSGWAEINIEFNGSIDWSLFDNDVSPSFSHTSFLVTSARPLEWLGQPGNIKVLIAMALSLCMGLFLGSFGMGLINLGYRMIQ